jgi:hypothetical protein
VPDAFENRYGLLDRALHRLAFASGSAQRALAELEDRLYRDLLAGIELRDPVLIAGLPRAGTTLLLELCSALPQFASHTYRDMPFLLCPLLWGRFSSRFQQRSPRRERAHGDGMQVSADSPEALEEVLWKLFWPQHYRADRIEPWQTAEDPEFRDFLHRHLKKIVALRCGERAAEGRYVSKNNANLARLAVLPELLPGARIVVPFREPLQHAASLLRQHRRFAELHAADRFARDYMEAVGHCEFGAALRPIDFAGWLAARASKSDQELGFWLEYWTAAYCHALSRAEPGGALYLLSYDELCARPARELGRLAEWLGIEDAHGLRGGAQRLAAPRPHPLRAEDVDAGIAERARALHRDLQRAAQR